MDVSQKIITLEVEPIQGHPRLSKTLYHTNLSEATIPGLFVILFVIFRILRSLLFSLRKRCVYHANADRNQT